MFNSNRLNIKQIARVAGVSAQTVSRVLNNRCDVSPVTRERVQKIITETGYRPSALARSLIRQRSFMLGVVISGLKHHGPSMTLNGIACRAEDLGYSVLLKEISKPEKEKMELLLRDLLAHQVDGILWAAPGFGPGFFEVARELSATLPVVFLNMETCPGLASTSYNNFLAGKLATEHLLQQGYRKIGHISGPLDSWESCQRKAGWLAAMQAAGVNVSEHNCVEGDWTLLGGEAAFRQLFSRSPDMEAVFASNDYMAIAVMSIARSLELSVPEQLGVVGVDGLPETNYSWPPLTTVLLDYHRLGGSAVDVAVRAIEKTRMIPARLSEPQPVILEPALLVRQSSLSPVRFS
jgi:DNA-binding LacI/PurR family transcriptional regulator